MFINIIHHIRYLQRISKTSFVLFKSILPSSLLFVAIISYNQLAIFAIITVVSLVYDFTDQIEQSWSIGCISQVGSLPRECQQEASTSTKR